MTVLGLVPPAEGRAREPVLSRLIIHCTVKVQSAILGGPQSCLLPVGFFLSYVFYGLSDSAVCTGAQCSDRQWFSPCLGMY